MGFSRPTDRLFFAIYPDAGAAARIDDLAWGYRDDNFLRGQPLQTQHFHSTLWHVSDDFFPPPSELVDSLIRRAKLVRMPRFLASFDYVESFSGGRTRPARTGRRRGPGNAPCPARERTQEQEGEAGELGICAARDAVTGPTASAFEGHRPH
jgi:hypothetical protein